MRGIGPIALAVISCALIGYAAEPAAGPGSATAFLAEAETLKAAVSQAIRNEAIWRDAAHKEEVVRCLKIIAVVRPREAVPVLVKHIDYTPRFKPEDFSDGRLRAIEDLFPVPAALEAIGAPAVQTILDEMNETDPLPLPSQECQRAEDVVRRGKILTRATMLADCLVKIYQQGGQGLKTARLRVELEAEKSEGQAKEYLLKALDLPAFKERTP